MSLSDETCGWSWDWYDAGNYGHPYATFHTSKPMNKPWYATVTQAGPDQKTVVVDAKGQHVAVITGPLGPLVGYLAQQWSKS